jgi:hypothetical protein
MVDIDKPPMSMIIRLMTVASTGRVMEMSDKTMAFPSWEAYCGVSRL